MEPPTPLYGADAPGKPAVRGRPFRFGLGLYAIKIAVAVVALALLFVRLHGGLDDGSFISIYLAPALRVLSEPALRVLSGLVGVVAGSVCAWAVTTTGLRGWFLATAALDAGKIALALVAALVVDPGEQRLTVEAGSGVLGLAAWGVLLLALRRFALQQDMSGLADEAGALPVRWLVRIGLSWGVGLLTLPTLVTEVQSVEGVAVLARSWFLPTVLILLVLGVVLNRRWLNDPVATALSAVVFAGFALFALSSWGLIGLVLLGVGLGLFLISLTLLLVYQTVISLVELLKLVQHLRGALESR